MGGFSIDGAEEWSKEAVGIDHRQGLASATAPGNPASAAPTKRGEDFQEMTLDDSGILDANAAFYRAFARRDVEAMEAIWARRAAVSCVHPGHRPLLGRDAVLASWQAILNNPAAPQIDCREPQTFATGSATAYVICTELVEGAFLAATNVFVLEDQVWRMVHHQAGQCQPPPQAAEIQARKTLQ